MQEVLKFLASLGKNNNKDWFDKNKKIYTEAKETFKTEVAKIIAACNKFDPAITGIDPAKCLFRINRDVRFSKDKSPYKTNFGAIITPGGKNAEMAGYYVHIEPGKSFIAAGSHMPMPDYLQAIRQEIDYNAAEFRKILKAKDFVANYKELVKEGALKNAPKGFEKDNQNLDLLRLKEFIVVKKIADKEILSKTFAADLAKSFKAALPLNSFLRRVKD
ncbi:MAG: DUF2461 domain-containing protein [Bacteroidota bacterium]|nr:DUF2461 domain-containing protein [Bacteroidota bacterium]